MTDVAEKKPEQVADAKPAASDEKVEKKEEPKAAPAEETKAEHANKSKSTKDDAGNDENAKQQEPTAENEIRVAAKGQIKNYLGYAFRILNKTNHTSLKIRATGNAIVKANILIELVKRRVGDLHQLNSIYSMVIQSQDDKNPLAEKINTQRRVTAMDTLLSKAPLDDKDPGYQEPVPKDEPFATSAKGGSGAASGGQTRPNEKKDQKDREGGKGRRRGPKVFNPPMKGDDAKAGSETKDAADKKGGKDKANKGKQDHDDKKKEKKGDKSDAKEGKTGDKEKSGRGRRSRKDKLNAPVVKDDEVQPGKKAKQERQRNRDRRQGGGMMQPDMYGHGPRGMGMGPGAPDGRGPPSYNMQQVDRGYGGPRRDHPRAMPPYMNYGGPKAYDDFNVRPQRGYKGNRRGPPHQMDPSRRPMDHYMYMYPPHDFHQGYGGYGMDHYNHGGHPDRRGYQGPAPNEPMRYNADPPQMNFREQRGERSHMRPGQGERGGRLGGPPDQRDPRGDGRGEPRGDPRDGRGPRDYAGGPPPREDDGRGPGGMRGPGGPGAPPMRGPRQGGPGGPPMRDDDRHRPYQQDSHGGPPSMRGGRGMRGSRGSGMRGGSDRAEPNGHMGGMDNEPMIRRNERGGRGRGDGGPHGHGGPSDGHERRGGRGNDEAGKSHQIVTRTRGGRGGKEGGPAQPYN